MSYADYAELRRRLEYLERIVATVIAHEKQLQKRIDEKTHLIVKCIDEIKEILNEKASVGWVLEKLGEDIE